MTGEKEKLLRRDTDSKKYLKISILKIFFKNTIKKMKR